MSGRLAQAAHLDVVTCRVVGFDDEEQSQFEGGAVLDEEDEDAAIEAASGCDLRLSEAPVVGFIAEAVCRNA